MENFVIKTVSARPSNLRWYHLSYIASLSSVSILLGTAAMYYNLFDDARTPNDFALPALFVFSCIFWYHAAYPLVSGRPSLKYDTENIRFYKNSQTELETSIPFTHIQQAIRRSINCFEFDLIQAAPFTNRLTFGRHRNFRTTNFNLQGEQKDLDQLSEVLRSRNVSVSHTSVPDDDPFKAKVTLFLTLGLSAVGIIGFIFSLIYFFPIS